MGSHCVKQLLEAGYRVKASVRDLENKKKTQPVLDLAGDGEKGRLELVQADLLDEDPWKRSGIQELV